MENDLLETGTSEEGKLRIIQESVPGKQVTLAHILSRPDPLIYQELSLTPGDDYEHSGIGILTMWPAEIAVIGGDLAFKNAQITMGFLDRFSGTLIFTGRISNVQSAISAILAYLKSKLGFTVCEITKT